MCGYVHVSTSALWRPEVRDLMELVFQMVVSHPELVLEAELRPSQEQKDC